MKIIHGFWDCPQVQGGTGVLGCILCCGGDTYRWKLFTFESVVLSFKLALNLLCRQSWPRTILPDSNPMY